MKRTAHSQCAVLLCDAFRTASPAPRRQREHQRGDLAGPSGSCSASAEATTPITGTAMVPIAATEAGSRASAANQLT